MSSLVKVACLCIAFSGLAGMALAANTYRTIDFPDAYSTAACGVNNAGDVVGGYTDNSVMHLGHGFLFSNGSYTAIDAPDSIFTIAFSINDARQIAGWYETKDLYKVYGFLFDGQNFTVLDYPGSTGKPFHGINNAGTIVGTHQLGVS